MAGKQIKCAACGAWTDGELENCLVCENEHHKKYSDDRKRRLSLPDWQFPWIVINPNDHWFVKGIKYLIRGGQAVFFFFMSLLAYIGSSAAH
jgi:hypothetical protein